MSYDAKVIENIENECALYIKRFKKLPRVVNLSKYEFQEYKKAFREGVRPRVEFQGKSIAVPVGQF